MKVSLSTLLSLIPGAPSQQWADSAAAGAMRLISLLAMLFLVTAAAFGQPESSESEPTVIWIGLQHGSEREALMAAELRALLREYDLQPWILTPRVLIDERQLPHSHPTLTIHTRHIGDELGLLATFVHEQLHWLEDEPRVGEFRAAMRDFEGLYPDVPGPSAGGARDQTSTYRHLLVCDLEFQAMTALVGEAAARETLSAFTHYQWIYDKVLSDSRVRQVTLRHGFDVSAGAGLLR